MSFQRISDESLTLFGPAQALGEKPNMEAALESIRRQADADRGHKHHFTASSSVRDRAEKLREELDRRKLQYSPIRWPT